MGDIKKVCGYLLALGTSLGICQPHILDDSLLTVVQIPGLCHMNSFSLLLFIDGIRGLAHPLSSGLTRKITLSLASSVFVICARRRSTNLLQLIEVVRLLDFELKDIQDTSVNVQHQCGHTSGSHYCPDDTVGVLKLDGKG